MPVSNVVGARFRRQLWILFSLCVVTPSGFLFKWYNGPGRWWFNDYGAGVLYEIFWCLVLLLLSPGSQTQNSALGGQPTSKSTIRIAVGVFAVTCVLEVLQLWHPAFLEKIRATFLGSALIGTTFVWWDFPHYALGSFIGWLWMRTIIKHRPCHGPAAQAFRKYDDD